jgi:outer membrane receptor protein involved in Fe transport
VDVTPGLPSGSAGQTRLPSRYLHDAGVTVPFGTRAAASLEVINVFDRKVVDVARYPLPGRMIHAGIRASF